MKRTLAVLALTFAAAPAFAEDASTIAQRLDDQWIAAYDKNDAAALTALYTKDAAVLPQGSPQPIIGSENIEKFMQGMVKGDHLKHMRLPVTEAKMIDPKTLLQVGTWEAEAGNQNLAGTYMSVIVQEGSDWKYRADTWNMMPPAAPATAAAQSTTGAGSSEPKK
jgi:uncharacterized protein (TIGR02246 family)